MMGINLGMVQMNLSALSDSYQYFEESRDSRFMRPVVHPHRRIPVQNQLNIQRLQFLKPEMSEATVTLLNQSLNAVK